MPDLACGRGRHARVLADEGFDVTGIDLSGNSINYALQYENDHMPKTDRNATLKRK
ncbi:MAG TPA: class I SAM-dependent methyltransferase [Puia sp.]|uniref:class I SAM-dependent methyltransferase n=1 Tax=Puia sp. TaxID=2045100 RepID=UPI002C49DD5A|nr:class I SAM-dependent methyltransferase [Puia sp.]HVU95918.1 class I SAM-dependent methyltransferase [Puia sp.]